MGANQSNSADSDGGDNVTVKTSYYELLGVERQATEDEIKKAYRRKALELHPDRNYGKEDDATQLFAEIQTAYEVLSDSQERAWYDSHETAILRGGGTGDDVAEEHFEANMKMTTADNVTAWMAKFHGRVDMSDSPKGFFGFLRESFERLAEEEVAAAKWGGLDAPDYPSFGHKEDDYEGVIRDFYLVWMNFSTKKSFSWKDAFRMADAPDRRYRRAMEKENKKRRDDGVREFNEAVRTLVAFVRKRDPRYTPNVQTDAEREKSLHQARKEQAARARAANAVKISEEPAVPAWAQTQELDKSEAFSEEEIEEEHFECVACSKLFKSQQQYEAHERSKKHQKAVYSLRRQMQKDGQRLGLSEKVVTDDVTSVEIDAAEDKVKSDIAANDMDALSLHNDSDGDEGGELDPEHVEQERHEATSATHSDIERDDRSQSSNEDYGPRSALYERLQGGDTLSTTPLESGSANEDEPASTQGSEKKLGKAAQKRAKKAAKQSVEQAQGADATCAVCHAVFQSKTKLHQHIEEEGHAALKVQSKGKGKGKKK